MGGRACPGVFLEARDDNELVYLDRLVRTLHALNFLQEREQHGGFLALNIHPQLLRAVRGHHGHVFEAILARCGLTPERIVLELADDGFGKLACLKAAVAAYRERGYRVAIDNFGRHSACLDRLEALAPDLVKLDRSLIGHAGHLSLAKRVMTELAPRSVASVPRWSASALKTLAAPGGPGCRGDWLQGYRLGRPASLPAPGQAPAAPGSGLKTGLAGPR
jgi:EAL domain-containing protein (putative c-di-GMP-specific phosphodiesterase class I)